MKFFNVIPNSVFGIHNPTGLKYLTRLRVGLSHLRSHKYKYNFRDTSSNSCSCSNIPEDVQHYLLHCRLYQHRRSKLFGNLRQIISLVSLVSPFFTYNLLLFGNSFYDDSTNCKILEATIAFIISTKRFDVYTIDI